MKVLEIHAKHGYCAELIEVTTDVLFVYLPANRILGISEKEVQVNLSDSELIFIESENNEKKIPLDRAGQVAFLSLYFTLQRKIRRMSVELFLMKNKDGELSKTIYDFIGCTDDQKKQASALIGLFLTSDEPPEEQAGIFNLLKTQLQELI